MGAVLFAIDRGLLHADRHGVVVGVATLALETLFGAAVYLPCLSALSASCRVELGGAVRGIRSRGLAKAA
jgi:hypothetical protein